MPSGEVNVWSNATSDPSAEIEGAGALGEFVAAAGGCGVEVAEGELLAGALAFTVPISSDSEVSAPTPEHPLTASAQDRTAGSNRRRGAVSMATVWHVQHHESVSWSRGGQACASPQPPSRIDLRIGQRNLERKSLRVLPSWDTTAAYEVGR